MDRYCTEGRLFPGRAAAVAALRSPADLLIRDLNTIAFVDTKQVDPKYRTRYQDKAGISCSLCSDTTRRFISLRRLLILTFVQYNDCLRTIFPLVPGSLDLPELQSFSR